MIGQLQARNRNLTCQHLLVEMLLRTSVQKHAWQTRHTSAGAGKHPISPYVPWASWAIIKDACACKWLNYASS